MALDISPPDLMLKIIWMVHFVLGTWALMSSYLTMPYFCGHVAILAFGFWAIVSKESVEAIVMMVATLIFSILNDILLISLYEPRTHKIGKDPYPDDVQNEHRFAVAMSIINLILKPVSLFLLYRIYQSRKSGDNVFDFRNFGVGSSSSSGGQNRSAYSQVESPSSHHQGQGQSPYISGYQSMPQGYHQQMPPPAAGQNTNEKMAPDSEA